MVDVSGRSTAVGPNQVDKANLSVSGPAAKAQITDLAVGSRSLWVAAASRGFDTGKVQGRKRRLAVDTIGLLLTVLVTAASVQDRDAAKPLLLSNLRKRFPAIKLA